MTNCKVRSVERVYFDIGHLADNLEPGNEVPGVSGTLIDAFKTRPDRRRATTAIALDKTGRG